jgi:hypothetical protein
MRVREEPIDTHNVTRDDPMSGVEGSSGRDSYAGATGAIEESASEAAKRGSALPRQKSACLSQAWSPGKELFGAVRFESGLPRSRKRLSPEASRSHTSLTRRILTARRSNEPRRAFPSPKIPFPLCLVCLWLWFEIHSLGGIRQTPEAGSALSACDIQRSHSIGGGKWSHNSTTSRRGNSTWQLSA